MFLFYHAEQNSENATYYKGKLFEQLLKLYLEQLGYDVQLRQKRNSLEYDLTGKARLGGNSLVGEAKAHDKSITGLDFSSFVGKMFPLHSRDASILGLYLSTSSLTPDADDYYRSLEQTNLKLEVKTGDKLMNSITEELGLPRVETLKNASDNLGVFPLSIHFLMTEVGPFLVQIAADGNGATPAWFVVMRGDGSIVHERAFLSSLQDGITELRELRPRFQELPRSLSESVRKEIPEGLILGSEWADYRLPTSPEVFIGRRKILERILDRIFEPNGTPVIQVKSRSGVGKSSLMAYICNQLKKREGVKTQLYDVRNIKSVLDLWSVVQRLTGETAPAVDLGEMERQLQRLSSSGVRHILLLDQFESTFALPELYDAYELVALSALKYRPWLTVIVARKSDLLTTYDNSKISVEHLNEFSESVALEDFNAEEAVELINRISAHAGRTISAEVKNYVLEFARGFPWLLKRTMTHILRLLGAGVQQAELIPSALRLDNLFDEELEELDEIERDYLVRIAQRLPATYQDLDRAFEEDRHLPEVLEKLTRYRLLRLSGSTYDTYNDVFKDYLVFQKLPDFRLSFIYRLGPSSVLGPFRHLSTQRPCTTEELAQMFRIATGSTLNLIRELRNLGLIEREGHFWIVPEVVLDSYGRGRLGEYIRQQFVKNGIITDLIAEIQAKGSLRVELLASFLVERFPFIIATRKTWRQYANKLRGWLRTVRLVEEHNGEICLPQADRATIAREIGNLKVTLQARGEGLHFLPGVYWSHVRSLFISVSQSVRDSGLTSKQKDALHSLQDIGICKEDGTFVVSSFEEVIEAARTAISGDNYVEFWKAVSLGEDLDEILKKQFGLALLQPSTIVWRRKLLINWGKALGILSKKQRRRTSAAPPTGVLDFGLGI